MRSRIAAICAVLALACGGLRQLDLVARPADDASTTAGRRPPITEASGADLQKNVPLTGRDRA